MGEYVLRTQILLPVAVRDAFAFFEDPANLARITPPWLNFRILTPLSAPIYAGARIDYQIRWLGLPLRWRTVIREYEPPFFFIDEQAKGPYKFWRHRHSFHPTPEGVLISDEVHYKLPLGWLGRLAHRFVVADQLRAIFRFRQQTVNAIICDGKGRWTDPVITVQEPQNPPSKTASPGTRTPAAL